MITNEEIKNKNMAIHLFLIITYGILRLHLLTFVCFQFCLILSMNFYAMFKMTLLSNYFLQKRKKKKKEE